MAVGVMPLVKESTNEFYYRHSCEWLKIYLAVPKKITPEIAVTHLVTKFILR